MSRMEKFLVSFLKNRQKQTMVCSPFRIVTRFLFSQFVFFLLDFSPFFTKKMEIVEI